MGVGDDEQAHQHLASIEKERSVANQRTLSFYPPSDVHSFAAVLRCLPFRSPFVLSGLALVVVAIRLGLQNLLRRKNATRAVSEL